MTTVIIMLLLMGIVIYRCQGCWCRKERTMRVTREKAAENRERIIAMAAKLFREKGFDAVGVDAIMDGVGLTHGGFYRHFRSKEDLAAQALAHGLAVSAELLDGQASLHDYVDSYLSQRHRDHPGEGCLVAALGADVARQGDTVRDPLTAHLPAALDRLTARMDGDDPAAARKQAIATMAGLLGALVLARAVNDPALSDEILTAARAVFGGTGCTGVGAP
jgi:TetR/AcrR family transcriptional regulator, transcriptional repressor for nem operon